MTNHCNWCLCVLSVYSSTSTWEQVIDVVLSIVISKAWQYNYV